MRPALLSFLLLLFCQASSVAQVNLTQGLKLYLPFTGNATDISGNTNTVTINGPALTTDRFGAANSAYFFDGINDYMEVTGGTGMKPQFPMSVSAWVNIISNVSGVNYFFDNDYVPNTFYGVWCNFSASAGWFLASNVGNGGPSGPSSRLSKISNVAIPLNTWHHVAVVYYSANNVRLFIDCKEVPGYYDGTGGQLVYSNNGICAIGIGDGNAAPGGETYINANIDELRFYDRALNDDEIVALYFYPQIPPAQAFQLPTNNLAIQCGSSVNIDATSNGIISYNWSDGTQGPTKTFTTAGTYIITVDDGCTTNTDTVIVTGNIQAPQITVSGGGSVCVGESVTLTVSGAQNYTWSPNIGLNTTSGPSVIATVNNAITYTVIGSDACGSDTATIAISPVSQSQASFNYTQDECTGNILVDNTSINAATYLWIWGSQTSTDQSPPINFQNSGNYIVTLITNPGTGCADTLVTTIESSVEEQTLYIPSAFTPNNDGINDLFKVYTNKECLASELYIFNCWGEIVFYTAYPFTTFWNGQYRGEKVPLGVYAYRFITPDKADRWGKIVVVR